MIDLRAVFQQGHWQLKVDELSSILLPRKGRFGLIDYEKAYSPNLKTGPDIFDLRGIDRENGALVVVRPDQYVSNVLPLDAHGELTAFFEQFLVDRHDLRHTPSGTSSQMIHTQSAHPLTATEQQALESSEGTCVRE